MSPVGPGLPPLSPTREEFHALAGRGEGGETWATAKGPDGRGVFRGLPAGLEATRYHSLVVLESRLPPDLEISPRGDDGEIRGLRHRRYPVEGVQLDPESILTGQGKALPVNFLALTPASAPA